MFGSMQSQEADIVDDSIAPASFRQRHGIKKRGVHNTFAYHKMTQYSCNLTAKT